MVQKVIDVQMLAARIANPQAASCQIAQSSWAASQAAS